MPLLAMFKNTAKEAGAVLKNTKARQVVAHKAENAVKSALTEGMKAEAGVFLAQAEKPSLLKQIADRLSGTPSAFISTGGKGIIQHIDPTGTLVRVGTNPAGSETIELLQKGYDYTPKTLEKFATRNNTWKNYIKEWKKEVPFWDRWPDGDIPVYTEQDKILGGQAKAILKRLNREQKSIPQETADMLAQHGFIHPTAPAAKLAAAEAAAEPALAEATMANENAERSVIGTFTSLLKRREPSVKLARI